VAKRPAMALATAHGDADLIVPIDASARLTVKLLKKGTLKVYEKFPDGMITTQTGIVKPDLLSLIKG
jgi:non-heme chloroperoxidase